jgi:nicotinamidase/pyrazinamidase
MAQNAIYSDPRTTALLLVDVQPDFMPGGGLAVADGDAILAGIRVQMESDRFRAQVATQDWHPAGHVSFASSHPGRTPLETISLHGHRQTLWPDHCIQGSAGAELHPALPWTKVDAVVRKGTDPRVDSYSGFRNNWNEEGERPSTGLAGFLRDLGIDTLVICGLARDVCVRWTAVDALDAGFRVLVAWDLTRPVDPSSDRDVMRDLEERGALILEASGSA